MTGPRRIKAISPLKWRALESLNYREFRLLWYGQVFTAMATWMDSIARGWLIYELTNSSFQLGLVRGVQAIPTLLLSPIAGSTADLYSRKTQILIAQVVDGLLYAWVAVMIITGDIQPWHVYLTSLGLATVQAFQLPSRAAMVADAVPPSCLTNAMGLNAVVFNSARSAGPALAGVLIALYGTRGLVLDSSAFLSAGDRLDDHAPTGTAPIKGGKESCRTPGIVPAKHSRRLEVQLEKL